AGDHLAAGAGPLGDDVREQRADVLRAPAGAEWDVHDVQPEVAHAAVLAVRLDAALPVDRLLRVEVAGVPEIRLHVYDAPEAPLQRPARDLVRAGVERELRRDAHQHAGAGRDGRVDGLVGRAVDAE